MVVVDGRDCWTLERAASVSWRVWNNVDAPIEEEGDFGGAAGGGGAYGDEPGDAVDGVLDGFGDGDLHLLDGHDAVIDADDDAGKVGLRKDRDGNLKRGVDAGEGEGEQKEEDGLGVTERARSAARRDRGGEDGRNGGSRGAHLSSASFPAGLSVSSDFLCCARLCRRRRVWRWGRCRF